MRRATVRSRLGARAWVGERLLLSGERLAEAIQVTGGECVGGAVIQLCRVFGEVKKLIAIDFWVPD